MRYNRSFLILSAVLLVGALLMPCFGAAFFTDGFESGDLTYTEGGVTWGGSQSGSGDALSVSSDSARTGTYSLKFTFGGGPGDAWSEQVYDLGAQYPEIYIHYYIWIPSTYVIRDDAPTNNKWGYIWDQAYSDENIAGMEWERDAATGRPRLFIKAGKSGGVLTCTNSVGSITSLGSVLFDNTYFDRWLEVQWHFKNDTGAGDGALELYLDNTLVIGGPNLSWAGAPCAQTNFQNGYLMGWANSGFDDNTIIYIDDVSFSDSYVGGVDSTPSAFSFTNVTGAALSTETTTDPCATVAGIDAGQTPAIFISGAGCTYNVDGGAYGSDNTTVGLDNVVCLRGTSSGSYSTTYPSCTLTIGGVNNTGAPWTVRTTDAASNPVAPRMRAGDMSGGWR